MASLFDKVQETETHEKLTPNNKKENKAVKKITKNSIKDKTVSAKFNSDIYNRFTEINKAQGITNNSALNMILTKYVRENSDIIDD